jgi:hypothetical protein
LLGSGDTEITLDALLSRIDIVGTAETEREAIVEYEGSDVALTDKIDDTVKYAVFVATLVIVTELVEEEETEIAGVKVLRVVNDGNIDSDTDAVDDDETRALFEAEADQVTDDVIDTIAVDVTVKVPINDCVNTVVADG